MMTAKQIVKVRQQLQDYVGEFGAEFGRSERRYWCGKYLQGLLQEGERKSIETMAVRVGGDDQALQQFVNQSPWEHEAVLLRLRQLMRSRMSADSVLVLDDTSLPKQGRHSVGVARQYCGALGKIANCQSIVIWYWAGPGLHWPLAAQLYLPAGVTNCTTPGSPYATVKLGTIVPGETVTLTLEFPEANGTLTTSCAGLDTPPQQFPYLIHTFTVHVPTKGGTIHAPATYKDTGTGGSATIVVKKVKS